MARTSSITISPTFYRDYLQSRFGDIEMSRGCYQEIDEEHDLPELVDLLRKDVRIRSKELPRCCSMRTYCRGCRYLLWNTLYQKMEARKHKALSG